MTTFIGLQQTGNLCLDATSTGKIISDGQGDFTDNGQCPKCKHAHIKTMPILVAEQRGIVEIVHDAIRDMARKSETHFVICPNCGWWGYPNKQ